MASRTTRPKTVTTVTATVAETTPEEMLVKFPILATKFDKVTLRPWIPSKSGNGFVSSVNFTGPIDAFTKGKTRNNWITLWRQSMEVAGVPLSKKINEGKEDESRVPWMAGSNLGLKGRDFMQMNNAAWAVATILAAK